MHLNPKTNSIEKINLSNFGFNILQVETKAACNMACSFCPYPLKDDKTSKLELVLLLILSQKILFL